MSPPSPRAPLPPAGDGPGGDGPELSLVIPVYDEAANLPATLERLDAGLRALPLRIEVLFVDDGSPDGSAELLERWAAGRGGVRVLRLARRHGMHTACRAGFEHARAPVVATTEAHPDHEVAELGRLFALLEPGVDIVAGVRRGRDALWWRKAGSWVLNRALGVLGASPFDDLGYLLMVFRRDVGLAAWSEPTIGGFLWALRGRSVRNVPVQCRYPSCRPSAFQPWQLVREALGVLGAGVRMRLGLARGAAGGPPAYVLAEAAEPVARLPRSEAS